MDKIVLEKRFKEFCMQLNKKDRVALLHHSDPDGFCSALVTMKALRQLSGKLPTYISHYEYENKKQAKAFIKQTKNKNLNKLVVVDIAIDSDPLSEEIFAPFKHVLLIDHHKLYKNLNSEKIVFIKAEWLSKRDPAKYACSKLCFDLFNALKRELPKKHIVNVSTLDWVACIGIIADMALDSWRGFVKKTMETRKLTLNNLNTLLEIIAATEVMAEHEMNSLLKEFFKAKSPRELLKSPFKKHVSAMRRERDRLVTGFEKKAEYFPSLDLFMYETNTSKEGIKSYVVNELSTLHPNQTIVLIQDSKKDTLRVSARRQDSKLKMNELLEHSIAGIPNANAGGHAPAAAARIPRKFKEKFKANILKEIKKAKESKTKIAL